MGTDPDILPGGRNGQRLDALNVLRQDLACTDRFVTKTRAAALSSNAGFAVADIMQLAVQKRHGLCSRSVQSIKQMAPRTVSAAETCSH